MSLLTVSTWNIGSLHENGRYEINLKYLKDEVLTKNHADIICLQECPNDPELLEQLKEWTGLPSSYYVITSESHVYLNHDMGLCILSRMPVTEISRFHPTKPQVEAWHNGKQEYWHAKLFLAVSGVFDGRKLTVITGHGFPFHRYNLDDGEHDDVISPSFSEVDNWIKDLRAELPDTLFCIAADFNYGDPLRFMPYLSGGFRDAFYGEATRPSGRKTDAVILPVQYSPVAKCNLKSPIKDDGRGYFDHNYVSASYNL